MNQRSKPYSDAGSERKRSGVAIRILRLLVGTGAVMAGVTLAYICFATVTAVILRYVFREPNRFLFESTEFALALTVFLSFGYVAWRNANVRVDLVPGRFVRFRKFANLFSSALVGMTMGVLAWFAVQILVRDLGSGVRMGSTFGLPRWVLMAGLVVGLTLIAITEITRAVCVLQGGVMEDEDKNDPEELVQP